MKKPALLHALTILIPIVHFYWDHSRDEGWLMFQTEYFFFHPKTHTSKEKIRFISESLTWLLPELPACLVLGGRRSICYLLAWKYCMLINIRYNKSTDFKKRAKANLCINDTMFKFRFSFSTIFLLWIKILLRNKSIRCA